MVGDGVNDALAVAAAQVGMVMGHGPDLTRDAGDVCLLSNELMRVPAAIELARRTVRTIRWNLAWAFGYNSLGLAAAAWGYLHPALAAVLMLVSSVLVIANSLRLLRTSGAGPNEARHAVAALVHGQEDHSQDGVRMRPAAAPPRGDDPT
jgi:cation transport ATPase